MSSNTAGDRISVDRAERLSRRSAERRVSRSMRAELLTSLETKYPELSRARRNREVIRAYVSGPNRQECEQCQSGTGRHRHGFASSSGTVSSGEPLRYYGKNAAIAWLSGLQLIEDARTRARTTRRNVMPGLLKPARRAYPELTPFGNWPMATLAEANPEYAVRLRTAELATVYGYAVKPVVDAVAMMVRRASDLDMRLAIESGDFSGLAESPLEAAKILGLAA